MRLKSLNPDKVLQAYIVGLAIGDGNLSNPNGRAVRLRISCDSKYPKLIDKIFYSLSILLPDNKANVEHQRNNENCINVSSYSNHWENLLGWKADKGSKFKQQVNIPKWIFNKTEYQVACLRGLIETDGTIYLDRGYQGVMFTSIIKPLAESVMEIFYNLGFQARLYCINPRTSKFNAQLRYNVRLSKNVQSFLDLVRPEKM